jgi:CubicO group peptidase (beta-lactamase class C family)
LLPASEDIERTCRVLFYQICWSFALRNHQICIAIILTMSKISTSVVAALRTTADAACADPVSDIPGVTVVVVNKNGEELFAHSSRNRGVGSTEPMTLDNIFWIASCTKMITGIACMQLVERVYWLSMVLKLLRSYPRS